MLGSGIYMAPQGLAQISNPKLAVLAMLITGIGTLLLSISFGRMSVRDPETGSVVVYTQKAFGDLPAFFVGWSYWCGCWLANGTIMIGGLSYFAYFFPSLAGTGFTKYGIVIAVVWFYTIINMIGVKEAGVFNLIITIIKVVPLIVILIIAVMHFDPVTTTTSASAATNSISSLPNGIAYCLWSFIGFEGITTVAGEVKRPNTILKATIISVVIVLLLYICLIYFGAGILDQATLANSASPFADIIKAATGGYWAGGFIAIAVLVSSFGCIGAWILSSARITYTLGEKGLMPPAFSKVNKKNGAPTNGLIINAVLMSIVLLVAYFNKQGNVYNFFMMLSTATFLVFYVFGAADEIALSKMNLKKLNVGRFISSSIMSLLAFCYAVYALYGAGGVAVQYTFLLMLAGIPFFIYTKFSQKSKQLQSK